MVYETRPRKMYRLTPPGEEMLDNWLRSSLAWSEVLDERDIALIKFLFAENRLTRGEVLAWLDAYEKQTDEWAGPRRVFSQALISEASLHQQLIYEMTLMELILLPPSGQMKYDQFLPLCRKKERWGQ